MTQKIVKFHKMLDCKLTTEELIESGDNIGRITQEIAVEIEENESIKKEMKAKMAELEATRSKLAIKVTRKAEMRSVEVSAVLDYDSGIYRESRLDTGEIIKERSLTDEERQMELVEQEQEEKEAAAADAESVAAEKATEDGEG